MLAIIYLAAAVDSRDFVHDLEERADDDDVFYTRYGPQVRGD